MRLKPKQIEILKENPFQNDLLERSESIKNLTEILSRTKDPFVISIDAPWGTGKTTFLQMWAKHLDSKRIRYIEFNAWKNDYCVDPLACFIGELSIQLKKIKNKAEDNTTERIENFKRIGIKLLKSTSPAIIKAVTCGALDLKDLTESNISEISGSIASFAIEEYLETQKTLEQFRKELGDIVKTLSDGNDSPFIIFIDELDRCRPRFAIEVLEIMKHLFDVPELIFVVAVDQEQLSHSVQTIYGQNMDSQGYLRRFFDLTYNLPTPAIRKFCTEQLERFELTDYLNSRINIPDFRGDQEVFIDLLVELHRIYKLSLRDVERLFTRFCIVALTTPKNYYLYPSLTCFLLVLALKNKDMYDVVTAKNKDLESVFKALKNNPEMESFLTNFDNHTNLVLQTNLACVLDPEFSYHTRVFNALADGKQQKIFAGRILEYGPRAKYNMDPNSLNYLRKKIEMAENIKN